MRDHPGDGGGLVTETRRGSRWKETGRSVIRTTPSRLHRFVPSIGHPVLDRRRPCSSPVSCRPRRPARPRGDRLCRTGTRPLPSRVVKAAAASLTVSVDYGLRRLRPWLPRQAQAGLGRQLAGEVHSWRTCLSGDERSCFTRASPAPAPCARIATRGSGPCFRYDLKTKPTCLRSSPGQFRRCRRTG